MGLAIHGLITRHGHNHLSRSDGSIGTTLLGTWTSSIVLMYQSNFILAINHHGWLASYDICLSVSVARRAAMKVTLGIIPAKKRINSYVFLVVLKTRIIVISVQRHRQVFIGLPFSYILPTSVQARLNVSITSSLDYSASGLPPHIAIKAV